MKIAICGTRGIPACYGGFETFAEELSTRLVERGYAVRVYGRRHVIDYSEQFYKGVEICLLPAPRHKYLETPVHAILSFLHLLFNRVDAVLVCNAANSPFIFILRLFGFPVAVNVDGIERLRAKWSRVGKWWYILGERCSVLFATRVISDADVIADYYKETYDCSSTVIRYGHSLEAEERAERKASDGLLAADFSDDQALFDELGVRPHAYILYVSRLEPENNAHLVIEAFNELSPEQRQGMPLVVVGDAPYADEYKAMLRERACDEVVFAGYRFREAYVALQLGAYAYVQATEVGGTHPALVEAMGFSNCIVVNGTPENVEVVGDAALIYEKNNVGQLRDHLAMLIDDESAAMRLQRAARTRAKAVFTWDKITSNYEDLFAELVAK